LLLRTVEENGVKNGDCLFGKGFLCGKIELCLRSFVSVLAFQAGRWVESDRQGHSLG